ncbi:MAG: hypothetical protein ACI9QQ_002132, partial [Myxococcota bacterium]
MARTLASFAHCVLQRTREHDTALGQQRRWKFS